jgi:hypothetical protein
MDVDRVIADLDTLSAADLRRLRKAIEDLYGHYESWTEEKPAPVKQYRQERIRCKNPGCKTCSEHGGHGPYWYAFWVENGKTRKQYLGKHLPAGVDVPAPTG